MKRCIKCGELKALTNFHKDSHKEDGYQIYCKECRLTLVKNWRLGKSIINKPLTNYLSPLRSNRQYVLNDKLTKGKCSRCGYDKNIKALHYHHVDSSTKKFRLSDLTSDWTIKEVQEEIDKCILVCANCHTELHDLTNNKSPYGTFSKRNIEVDLSQEDFIKFLTNSD